MSDNEVEWGEPEPTFLRVQEFNKAFEVYMSPHPSLPGLTEEMKNELYKLRMLIRDRSMYWHAVCFRHNNSPIAMRMHLMLEEFGEVVEAILKEDMVGLLKEFCDQQIVNQGSVQVFGLAEIFTMGMHLVCDSNMSKLVDGKPVKNEVGRIQKGPNYRPPNLLPLFERYRSEGK